MVAAAWYAWPRHDAFFTTALTLPWVIIGLSHIARRIGAQTPACLRSGLAVTGLGLVLRHRLGWPQVDALWATAFLLLLGAFLWHLLPRLRRLLRTGSPSWVFFALPFLVHAAIMPWTLEQRQPDGDEPYYLMLSHSLTYDQDVELSNNYASEHWRRFMDRPIEPQPGDPRGADGEIYSRHNALLPALLVPFYVLGGRFGVGLAMIAMTAALAWLSLRVALRLWPSRATGALCAWAMLAFTPPLIIYSNQIWVEVPAALLLIFAVDRVLCLHGRAGADRASTTALVLQLGASVVLLPMLKLRFVLVALPIVVLACLPLRRHRVALMGLGTGLLLALGAMLASMSGATAIR